MKAQTERGMEKMMLMSLGEYFRVTKLPFTFRQEPVPGTGKRRCRSRTHGYRRPRTANERRQNSDKELQPLIRSKRQPHMLPDVYDDIYRKPQRCWKENGKCRRQWE